MDDELINDMNEDNFSDDTGPESSPRIYDDDAVTDDSVVDPITVEAQGEKDDPAKLLQVPPGELKSELDKRAFDGTDKPSGEGEERHYDADAVDSEYEGQDDDLANEQEDAADNASDNLESQDEAAGRL